MSDVVLRDAATVMLVRDGTEGLEVFMLLRNLRSDFVGGAYVFPGGAVDDGDRSPELHPFCEGLGDPEASAALGMASGGLGFWVAAIREAFEEAGVLLALDGTGATVRLAPDEHTARRFADHRRTVDDGERSLLEVCRREGLRLDVGGMHLFSHWITPVGAPRRYDTRFFVARAPEGQVPVHDDREAVDNCWVRPAEALADHRAGRFQMILPTVRSLEALERFTTADEVLAAAAAIESVTPILPRIVVDGDRVDVLVPGDDGFDDAGGAGPTGPIAMDRLGAATASGANGRPATGGTR